MMPPKKDTQKTEKDASLEQSTHGQAELLTIDQKGKKDNVEGNGQASGQDQVGSTTEEEGPSLTDVVIIDANDASVEADSPDSMIQPKNGQNQDGNGDKHFQVEPDDKNESGTDGNVELEEQPNRQGKPVDSTGQPPLTSTNNDNEKTPNASVQTNTSNSHNDSLSDYTPSKLTKGKHMEGSDNKGKKALAPVPRPGGGKKGNAIGGRGKNTGHDVTGSIKIQPPHSVDSSGNDNTDNALPQSSAPDSNEIVTDEAESEGDATRCTHFKTVWGLRLDVLLLTIVVLLAAIIVKLPLGARQVVTENPPIQQMSELVDQLNEVKGMLRVLENGIEKNSGNHRTQASKLDEIDAKINDILNPSDSNEMSYPEIKIKVGQIKESITESQTETAEKFHTALKDSMENIQRNLSTAITKQEEINSNLTTNISNIREDVIPNISVRFGLVELAAKRLQTDYQITDSKVKDIERVLNETDVQEIQKNAEYAKETADQANVKLKTVEQHLFNKGALTAAILILFFLIIGLMLYVLKLKSSLEPSLAGGSAYRPLKGSREMTVVLQKMPRDPTLDNAVCIVSFDSSYSEEYKGMIKATVGQLGGVSFRTHVIRKHADIAELPHCRLYIMCVEFTERHVIIEEQGLGLGDLKLTSYRGVRKLGGALVILYIHDPGSRRLTDDQLYSDGVYCVKKQQELKELCEIDRFISAHNELNTAQKKALETAISNVLNIKAARP